MRRSESWAGEGQGFGWGKFMVRDGAFPKKQRWGFEGSTDTQESQLVSSSCFHSELNEAKGTRFFGSDVAMQKKRYYRTTLT